MRWLREFWRAGWNHKRITALLATSVMQIRMNTALQVESTRCLADYRSEVQRLVQQTEHDALMLQAYANWCAAHGCTPTRKDLELASGKK